MTSNPPASASGPEGQVPGAPAAAICKRPGCGNILPGQDRGRARQFCGDECARRYHNDARVPAPAAVPAPVAAPAPVVPEPFSLTELNAKLAGTAGEARPGQPIRRPMTGRIRGPGGDPAQAVLPGCQERIIPL